MKSGNKLDLICYILLSIPNILAVIVIVGYAVEAIGAIIAGVTNPVNYGVLVVGGTVLLSVFLAPILVAIALVVSLYLLIVGIMLVVNMCRKDKRGKLS